MSCRKNKVCDFCDSRCADYYEETEEYVATDCQVRMTDGTYKYCKILCYKVPVYDKQNGQQVICDIIVE